eukprot:g16613.t1
MAHLSVKLRRPPSHDFKGSFYVLHHLKFHFADAALSKTDPNTIIKTKHDQYTCNCTCCISSLTLSEAISSSLIFVSSYFSPDSPPVSVPASPSHSPPSASSASSATPLPHCHPAHRTRNELSSACSATPLTHCYPADRTGNELCLFCRSCLHELFVDHVPWLRHRDLYQVKSLDNSSLPHRIAAPRKNDVSVSRSKITRYLRVAGLAQSSPKRHAILHTPF